MTPVFGVGTPGGRMREGSIIDFGKLGAVIGPERNRLNVLRELLDAPCDFGEMSVASLIANKSVIDYLDLDVATDVLQLGPNTGSGRTIGGGVTKNDRKPRI